MKYIFTEKRSDENKNYKQIIKRVYGEDTLAILNAKLNKQRDAILANYMVLQDNVLRLLAVQEIIVSDS